MMLVDIVLPLHTALLVIVPSYRAGVVVEFKVLVL